MKILNYEIPENLQDDRFILSLKSQFDTRGSLSPKQEACLTDMLEIELVPQTYETKSIKRYKKYFNRCDYHGDYYIDSSYAYNVENPNTKIDDYNSIDHGCAQTHDEYKFDCEIEIPSTIQNVNYFMDYIYNEFCDLEEKIKRNRFRNLKNRNKAIRAFNGVLNNEHNKGLIDEALCKNYRYY